MDIPKSVQREQNVRAIQQSYISEMCVFVINTTNSYIIDGDLNTDNLAKLKDLRVKIKALNKNVQADKYDLQTLEDYVQKMCVFYDDFSHFVFDEIKDYELEV